jgi:hypothetical protein
MSLGSPRSITSSKFSRITAANRDETRADAASGSEMEIQISSPRGS